MSQAFTVSHLGLKHCVCSWSWHWTSCLALPLSTSVVTADASTALHAT